MPQDLIPLPFNRDGADTEKINVIAGPCAAESRQQVVDTARQLRDIGVEIFRAGIWKPRTRPGGFEGVGEPGLQWLREVKETTGMLVATEVANAAHTRRALDAGVDIIWLGARTVANPFAVQEVADTIAAVNKDVAVLVKNPVSPDLELWIGAFMRLYGAGIRRLGAVHRGFSNYGTHLYRNPPQWSIPLELRRRYPELPIIFDPSHIGGNRNLIAPLSQQALDIGFDALIVESHCCPDEALSDAAQQITPSQLGEILNHLTQRKNRSAGGNDGLAPFRETIDDIDNQLLTLLSSRMDVSREIGKYKKQHSLPILQTSRFDSILESRLKIARQLGLDERFVSKVLSAIHEESVRQQM